MSKYNDYASEQLIKNFRNDLFSEGLLKLIDENSDKLKPIIFIVGNGHLKGLKERFSEQASNLRVKYHENLQNDILNPLSELYAELPKLNEEINQECLGLEIEAQPSLSNRL